MSMIVFHNGIRFRAETNLARGSLLVVCKQSGSYAYVRGAQAYKMLDALGIGWNKFGLSADGDDVWQWIWTNCGFYRLASDGELE